MKKEYTGITSGRMCTEDKGDAGCLSATWHTGMASSRICLLELTGSSQKNCLSGWQKRSVV